jgi:hypothetical protein
VALAHPWAQWGPAGQSAPEFLVHLAAQHRLVGPLVLTALGVLCNPLDPSGPGGEGRGGRINTKIDRSADGWRETQ